MLYTFLGFQTLSYIDLLETDHSELFFPISNENLEINSTQNRNGICCMIELVIKPFSSYSDVVIIGRKNIFNDWLMNFQKSCSLASY